MAKTKRRPATNDSILGQPLGEHELHAMAKDALTLGATIRDYLPVVGDDKTERHWKRVEHWYSFAVNTYMRIERLRNPNQLPWPGAGSFHASMSEEAFRHGAFDCFQELSDALNPLVEHYGWQGVSDGSSIPCSATHAGNTIPPVDGRLLDEIEKPARRLSELIPQLPQSPKPQGKRPEVPVVHRDASGDRIEWQGTKYPVTPNWVEAFQKMVDAKGRPVGLTGILRKPAEDLKKLKADHPELAALVKKGNGNSGFYLSCF